MTSSNGHIVQFYHCMLLFGIFYYRVPQGCSVASRQSPGCIKMCLASDPRNLPH